MSFPERFSFGFTPETGKKADLMFAQHVLAVLKPDGLGATVMPHGVLFRGGKEKEIRTGIIEADRLEAVIGLAPNLFYGTGIPACILVLRGTAPRPPRTRGKVLFINADREFTSGRAQNYLDPQHAEKIVSAFREYRDIPSFARVVEIGELVDNDFNLNIRRYVDNTPPPEPQDVRAHLHGGVPKAEVTVHADRFAAYGLDVHALFAERDDAYYDFPPDGWQQAADCIPALAAPKENELHEAFDDWWNRHVKHIVELPDTKRVMETRADLLDSFVTALKPLGVLDRFQLAGVIASWWGDAQYDIKTLAFHQFSGVVQGWLTTIEAAFADDEDEVRDKQKRAAEKRKAREHRVVPVLIPDYLNALDMAEARRAELEAQVKLATAPADEDDDIPAETMGEQDLKRLKADLADAKRRAKHLEREFLDRLKQAVVRLDSDSEEALVRRILKVDVEDRLDAEVGVGRRALVDRYCAWAKKYAITLHALQAERDAATAQISVYLRELGYE